ncbi:transposase [Streptomyces sp. NPDC020412]|uniref:transposase n=1 Tax=Streptomyces sp. NPDC020412 TaxID=3365073 RepID=UPI0037A17741
MADAEWAAVRPLLPVPGWLAGWLNGRGGRPEGYCHRQLLDAIRYLVAGGICWRGMPADLPRAMAALPGNQPSGFGVSGGAAFHRVARELPRQSGGAVAGALIAGLRGRRGHGRVTDRAPGVRSGSPWGEIAS